MGDRRTWVVRKNATQTLQGGRSQQVVAQSQVVYANDEPTAREMGAEVLNAPAGSIQVFEVESFMPDDEELAQRAAEHQAATGVGGETGGIPDYLRDIHKKKFQ